MSTLHEIAVLEVGGLGVNCYVVHGGPDGESPASRPCVAIDPGGDAGAVSAKIRRLGLTLETILLTHAHADHIGGAEELLADWPGSVLACSEETSRRAGDPRLNLSVYMGGAVVCPPAGRVIADGETFRAGGLGWRALAVPGHDPGELVYIMGDDEAVFAGDVVFERSVGRSDFPGGDGEALARGVHRLLCALAPDTPVYPGHGPATTAGGELAFNPYLQRFRRG